MRRIWVFTLVALLAFASGCRHFAKIGNLFDRRAKVEAAIARDGMQDDPAVEASRAELEAEIAREEGEAVVDSLELRVGAEVQGDASVPVLARLPLANPAAVRAQKEAQHASSEAALAKLEEVALERRAALCLPSLDRLVYAERMQIYERYAGRQRELVKWNAQLVRAGMLDEVAAAGFELSSKVDLATRVPNPLALAAVRPDRTYAVLPALPDRVEEFGAQPERVRAEVLRSQPAIGVHRALKERYQALARSENASRYPSVKFVDLGFEPVTHRGQQQSVLGRVGIEIPFGTKARAEARHYSALANSQTSQERAVVEERMLEAQLALSELQTFHDRSAHWRELLVLADSAEAVADRWFAQRLARPDEVAGLLDEVFRTREAVLKARERAGLADCSLLAATGVSAASWPRE